MTKYVPRANTEAELLVFERTDVGRVRDHNEDSMYSDLEGRFFVVADGMGGHAAGEVASQLAVEEVRTVLSSEQGVLNGIGSKPSPRTHPIMTELLTRAGTLANEVVRKRASEDKAKEGMGTTLEVACITGDGVWIGHVGDSRTYLVRGNSVTQLTTDHTVAERLAKNKGVNRAAVFEQWGSVLVEAIGANEQVNVEVLHSALQSGDRLLLCSDGLYEYFPRAEEIGEVLGMEGSQAGLERLVDLALDRGGKDNITGVVVEVVKAPNNVIGTQSQEGSENIAYDTTVDSFDPIEDDEQDYGIEEAIALMRKLPGKNAELEVRVLAATLKSANITVAPIIRDASLKQVRIERRIDTLGSEIGSLKDEVSDCLKEIAALEEDREETTMVKERLQLAQNLVPSSGA